MTNNEPNTAIATDAREIARQAEVELAILLSVKQSLRFAIQLMTRGRGNCHKLSTLRFALATFERHLIRTRILSDHGGYMHATTDVNPHLANKVKTLKAKRKKIDSTLERLILQLECMSPMDDDALKCACKELEHYLEQLELHAQKEMALFQHSFVQEEGGEG